MLISINEAFRYHTPFPRDFGHEELMLHKQQRIHHSQLNYRVVDATRYSFYSGCHTHSLNRVLYSQHWRHILNVVIHHAGFGQTQLLQLRSLNKDLMQYLQGRLLGDIDDAVCFGQC